jgi:hypothetical protein
MARRQVVVARRSHLNLGVALAAATAEAGDNGSPETLMAKKPKVPKTIAGVKLPKALRRGLRELGASDKGRALLGEALDAAGSALASDQTPTGEAGSPMAEALQDAARAFMETLRRREIAAAPAATVPSPSPATH